MVGIGERLNGWREKLISIALTTLISVVITGTASYFFLQSTLKDRIHQNNQLINDARREVQSNDKDIAYFHSLKISDRLSILEWRTNVIPPADWQEWRRRLDQDIQEIRDEIRKWRWLRERGEYRGTTREWP